MRRSFNAIPPSSGGKGGAIFFEAQQPVLRVGQRKPMAVNEGAASFERHT
jgi:hypothetical protein